MSNTYPAVPPVGSTGIGDITESGTSTDVAATSVSGGTGGDAGQSGSGKKDEAKNQASQLGHQAAEAGQHVTGVAKDEVSKVASEAKTQVKDLYSEAKVQLREQAGAQQDRVVTGLHSLSDELKSMADKSETQGLATDLAHQVATRAGSAASWLEGREPGSLLDEVRQFARRKPGTFIGIAAVAGVLAGRLTRNIASEVKDEKDAANAGGSQTTTVPSVGGYDSTTSYDGIRPMDDAPVGFDRTVAGSDEYYLGEPRP